MNNTMLETMAAWGDQQNREVATLLDLVAAGVIDQTMGSGTITLRPGRLEEIVDRIAPRVPDKDGGWVLTLLPAEGDVEPVNPRDVIEYVREHDKDMPPGVLVDLVAVAAEQGVTMRDINLAGYPGFVEWCLERHIQRAIDNRSS